MIEAMLQAERLLGVGMLDEAEALYRRAAEADPRNAMALVGLARVASERGDDAAALAHARSALQVDPQNNLAQRLEARLAEIVTGRSDATSEPRSGAAIEPPAADLPAAAQRAAFARNPSMADHRSRMDTSTTPPPTSDTAATGAGPASPKVGRRSLLRRLLGR